MKPGESRERMNWLEAAEQKRDDSALCESRAGKPQAGHTYRVATERKAKEIADAKEVEEGSPSQKEGSTGSHPQAPSAMSNNQDGPTKMRPMSGLARRPLRGD